MDNIDGIDLPPGLNWTDEFRSSGVAQTTKRSLAGSLVVFHAPLVAGRPITLESAADMGWAQKPAVDQLVALANAPGAVYSLTLRGVTQSVLFRHENGSPGFEATPVMPGGEQGPDAYFQIKLRLLTI